MSFSRLWCIIVFSRCYVIFPIVVYYCIFLSFGAPLQIPKRPSKSQNAPAEGAHATPQGAHAPFSTQIHPKFPNLWVQKYVFQYKYFLYSHRSFKSVCTRRTRPHAPPTPEKRVLLYFLCSHRSFSGAYGLLLYYLIIPKQPVHKYRGHSIKNDPSGNRTPDLPASSLVHYQLHYPSFSCLRSPHRSTQRKTH